MIEYIDDYIENTSANNELNASQGEKISSLDFSVEWCNNDSRTEQLCLLLKEFHKLVEIKNSDNSLYIILIRRHIELPNKTRGYLYYKTKVIDYLGDNGIDLRDHFSREKLNDFGETKYYSVISKLTNENFRDVHKILELLPDSFIVSGKIMPSELSNSSILTQRIQQKEKWWFNFSSLNEILSHEKERILIRTYGSFDDPETSLICIGRSDFIKSLNS